MFGIAVFIFSWIHTFAHVANSINQASLRDTPHFMYMHIFNMQLLQFVACIPLTAMSCLLIRAPLPNCIAADMAANSVCVLKSVCLQLRPCRPRHQATPSHLCATSIHLTMFQMAQRPAPLTSRHLGPTSLAMATLCLAGGPQKQPSQVHLQLSHVAP